MRSFCAELCRATYEERKVLGDGGCHPAWCGLERILPLSESMGLDGPGGTGPDTRSYLLETSPMASNGGQGRLGTFAPPPRF